ncbi:hypothetical protein GYB29_02470 [bacterium]|jgi:hypothetical protein|nr:hypothetical protein [bacterium]
MLKKLIYLNIVFAIVLNWFSENPDISLYGMSYLGIMPKQLFGLVELFSIVIFIILLKHFRKNKTFNLTLLIIFMGVLFYIPYTILWGGNIYNVLLGLRNFVSFVPIFFAGYYLSQKGYSIKPYLTLIVLLCLVQIPVTIFQYLFSFSLLTRGTSYDAVAGTMGGLNTNVLAILLICVIITLIKIYLRFKSKKFLVIAALLFIPPVLGDAKGVFVLLFIGLIFLLMLSEVSINRKITFTFVSVIMFSLLSILYTNIIQEESRRVLDPEYYLTYEVSKKYREGDNIRLSRIESVSYATELVNNNPFTFIFGYGLGNASRNNLYGSDGEYFSSTKIIHFWDKTLTEIGFLGFFLVLSLMVRIFFILRRLEKRLFYQDEFISTLSGGMSIVILLMVLSGFYTDHISKVQIMYPLSLLLGYLYSSYNLSKRNH